MIYAHSLRYFNKYVKLNNKISSIKYIVKKGKEKKYKKWRIRKQYRVKKDKKINVEYKMWFINVGLGTGIADSI